MDELKEARGPRLFFGYIGIFFIMIGFIILVPLILLIFYPNESSEYHLFLGPAVTSITIGCLLYFLLIHGRKKTRLGKIESFSLLICIWIFSIFIASLPFMITKRFNFTKAIFEATSAFTTTARTLLNDDELVYCTHIFKFYRVWLLFVGGIGLSLILTSAISDSANLSIYNLEGHNDRLLPNLIKSSRIILLIYTVYIAIGVIAYLCCGMPLFDAICNSISALSTGGFASNPGGIGYYNSISIEIVTEILMLLGATNFMIHFFLITGKFKTAFYHCEFLCFAIMMVIFLPIMVYGFSKYYNSVGMGFRQGIFTFIAATTSTGFTLADQNVIFEYAPVYLYTVIFVCMILGGQSGSTSGGIKQMRIVQAFKQMRWSIRDMIKSPHLIESRTIVRYGVKENATPEEGRGATTFIFLYVLIIFTGSFIFTCYGNDFQTSMFEFSALLSTTGYSFGIVVDSAPTGILWFSIFAMLIGRLEPLIFIMLINKSIDNIKEFFKRKYIEKKLNK